VLVTGGYAALGYNSVTLFNWLTLENCSLPALPYFVSGHSMTSSLGVPMFCAGGEPCCGTIRNTCYKFNPTTKGWTKVYEKNFNF
jgi:hypothetical protein